MPPWYHAAKTSVKQNRLPPIDSKLKTNCMATIKEVARHAKVSVGTVSNVLAGSPQVNSALRERVQAAIRELDYHPDHVARSLKIRQTKMLGLIIADITNPFFPQIIRGAEDAALAHGYLLVTINTDDRVEREKQALSVLRGRRADGILLVVVPAEGRLPTSELRSPRASPSYVLIACLTESTSTRLLRMIYKAPRFVYATCCPSDTAGSRSSPDRTSYGQPGTVWKVIRSR